MKTEKIISIDEVEKLLLNNDFERQDYSRFNTKSEDWCGKLKEDFEVSWGHSDIRTYRRNNELINVQYQDKEMMGIIFEELPLQHETNSVYSHQSLNTYNAFKSIKDIISLCKFARGIKLVLS